ncbi:ASI1-immunoprecipitated protein 1 isoform X3 [Ziziphus jujuba]|uniref:ASI1-immunoprecipitated protein 1 isoform X3 n=1 Tax=Ziziphus jujuba TaxID=326968 RepID=A0ABM3IRX1_ZIZJJ|nr:ASI1-immunoprecipitated protein 1 isoform X3 [Ziziphus jujuba]XP_048334209.2 ASI1-immunoprecipitated protein 1 isoform X3 [Ziziphus jujuba]XP_048334210.2 ASI1-immunoprecipitated protein 1 isoform X3 [Ziziphus jujuba]
MGTSAEAEYAAFEDKFIPNYLGPSNLAKCALIEMEHAKQVEGVILAATESPFMISGMPRPVRARRAEMEMFDERPAKPGRKIVCSWMKPNDPSFADAMQLKNFAKKSFAEADLLLEKQLQEEEKLAHQQQDTLKTNYKKYEMIDALLADGTARRLARRYNMNVADD